MRADVGAEILQHGVDGHLLGIGILRQAAIDRGTLVILFLEACKEFVRRFSAA
jgi:hypothetical protein